MPKVLTVDGSVKIGAYRLYIISAFFSGISVGSIIALIIYNRTK